MDVANDEQRICNALIRAVRSFADRNFDRASLAARETFASHFFFLLIFHLRHALLVSRIHRACASLLVLARSVADRFLLDARHVRVDLHFLLVRVPSRAHLRCDIVEEPSYLSSLFSFDFVHSGFRVELVGRNVVELRRRCLLGEVFIFKCKLLFFVLQRRRLVARSAVIFLGIIS